MPYSAEGSDDFSGAAATLDSTGDWQTIGVEPDWSRDGAGVAQANQAYRTACTWLTETSTEYQAVEITIHDGDDFAIGMRAATPGSPVHDEIRYADGPTLLYNEEYQTGYAWDNVGPGDVLRVEVDEGDDDYHVSVNGVERLVVTPTRAGGAGSNYVCLIANNSQEWESFVVESTGGSSGTTYDETGRAVDVTAATAATDVVARVDGSDVEISAATAATDTADFAEPVLDVEISSTVSGSDQALVDETGATLNISSTVQGSDVVASTETLDLDVSSTVQGSDVGAFVDDLDLALVSGVSGSDSVGEVSENVEAVATATVSGVDSVGSVESVGVEISSTVAGSDTLGDAIDESGLEATGTVTTSATDRLAAVDPVLVAAAAVVDASDVAAFVEAVEETIAALTSGADVAAFVDSSAVEISSTVTGDALPPDTRDSVEGSTTLGATIAATTTRGDLISGSTTRGEILEGTTAHG